MDLKYESRANILVNFFFFHFYVQQFSFKDSLQADNSSRLSLGLVLVRNNLSW